MQPTADYPVEIRGFVTDPKAVGFQVLTNYESTFLRAYVGNDAWGLYEVLRSFCHDGNNTCHPSINYLLAILGIKQRRVLTGWTTNVKGKQYTYPGLIEILQQAELLVAEVDDEGPNQRYIFHVNLTPGMLTPQQVATLPPLMQTKHQELIQRHLDNLAALERKRRPPKTAPATLQNPLPGSGDPPNFIGEIGDDKLSDPVTNCREGGDKLSQQHDNLSPKQHPLNTTQRTPTRASQLINNNSGQSKSHEDAHKHTNDVSGDDPLQQERHAVVVALLDQGVAEKVAMRLGEQYPPERIRQKIDYLTYVLEEDPTRIKNPRGWLRRAIEENYGPPDGYAPPAERANRESRAAAERRRQYLPEEYLPYFANSQPGDTAPPPAAADPTSNDSVPDGSMVGDPMAVDMRPAAAQPAPPAAQQAGAGRTSGLTRAARRAILRQEYGVSDAAQAFWESALHDLRHTTTPDFFELVADAEIVALSDAALHLAVWDEAHYRRLQHPGLQKALSRDLSLLAQRKLHVVIEHWQDTPRSLAPRDDAPP